MEIKTGDYVRCDYHKDFMPIKIARIEIKSYDEDEKNTYYLTDDGFVIDMENVISFSESLADLVEVGDFIEYKQSNIYYNVPTRVYGRYNRKNGLTELMVSETPLKEVEVTSIVTKEQFEQMSYKVEQSE